MATQASKNYIKQVSARATQIQQTAGTKVIPAQTVYKMTRSEAVKKAAQEMKALKGLNK